MIKYNFSVLKIHRIISRLFNFMTMRQKRHFIHNSLIVDVGHNKKNITHPLSVSSLTNLTKNILMRVIKYMYLFSFKNIRIKSIYFRF